ncbi:MAG: 3',5'-cyclic-nucleotide phosphodiesterase [Candidatus Accumulibacter sp.]|jgi:ribonuclease BN (tRNA processing enzyme)|nr:3',5'-cyclic-nucleotide phosphodiesterase [Accumulibacter sp.]
MKVRVLGCSGGIGGPRMRTTSLRVDDDILIDAGTGLADLPLEELAQIDHVFLTHSHLDHIAMLPLMLDATISLRNRPLTVYALKETTDILKKHIFNWGVWPDFSTIPHRGSQALQYREIAVGETLAVGERGGRTITVLPAIHNVPAVGYLLDSGKGCLAFTGDTESNDALWPILNEVARLRILIIETTFPNREKKLAIASKHLYPEKLDDQLKRLKSDPEIYVFHFKPAHAESLMDEIDECVRGFTLRPLQNDMVFEF